MPNYSQRHNYYVRRTIQWLESLGISCQKVETNYTIQVGGRSTFVKRDMWGADVAARDAECIGYIQVKTGKNQVSGGIKQLTKDDNWPACVGRFVVWWDQGGRLSAGPNVVAVSEGTCQKIRDHAKTYRTIT